MLVCQKSILFDAGMIKLLNQKVGLLGLSTDTTSHCSWVDCEGDNTAGACVKGDLSACSKVSFSPRPSFFRLSSSLRWFAMRALSDELVVGPPSLSSLFSFAFTTLDTDYALHLVFIHLPVPCCPLLWSQYVLSTSSLHLVTSTRRTKR